jgi:transposase
MNVLKPDKKSTILTLLKNGVSQREIGRKTNIDRKTIRKYAKESDLLPEAVDLDSKSPTLATGADCIISENPPPRPPVNSTSKEEKRTIPLHARSACEPHREWIEKQVKLGRNAVAIYQDLVERFAFTHKYNSVKRFVRGLRKEDPKQFDRLEFSPGEEAQVDYGMGAKTLNPARKYHKPRLFIMTLKYSRRSFRKVVWRSSKETWAKLHEEAFRYFGGCPQYVVLDNLKEGVIKPDLYEPELNVVYAAMLEHYGVVADPARVRDPNRKGTVENAVQHTQDTALKGRTFETIERQNEWLMHWEKRWASQRIHGRVKRQVEEMFQEEKPHLKQLPLTAFSYFSQETRTVWDDGAIQVGKSYYSALPAPLYTKVIVRIYDNEIEIIDPVTMVLLRRHIKSSRPGSVDMTPEDRIFNPSRQTKYLFTKAESIGPATLKLCKVLFEEEGRTGQRRMQGIVNLVRHYEARYVEQACIKANDVGLRSYKSIRHLVKTLAEKNRREKDSEGLIQEHKLIRPPEDYAAFWEQHAAQTRVYTGKNRFVMPKEQLPAVWKNASWERVIDVFGLEVDGNRRCKANETWIKSPFTGENTASLHLNLTENIFKDFSSGLGAKVGVLNFCQDLLALRGQTMNCYEVASWMVENGISDISSHEVKNHVSEPKNPKENKPIRVDLRRFVQPQHPELKHRQVSEATCRYLGCGFLPEGPNGNKQSPLNGRLVFQVRGLSGAILTHIGRALTPRQEKRNGKYWSFPFFKKLEIYNQDKLLSDVSARQQVEQLGLVLVEGFFDVAVLVESGCLNVGALMGSHITEQQAARIKFISSHIEIPKITVFLDRDEAGIIGAQKAVAVLRKNGFSAEAFDWNQTLGSSFLKIPGAVMDPGDMSPKQLKWLREQGKI